MQKIENYILEGIRAKTIKLCPFCKTPTELATGCNYLTCPCGGGVNRRGEWCWVCTLPKYAPDPLAPLAPLAPLGANGASGANGADKCCNNRDHNSH